MTKKQKTISAVVCLVLAVAIIVGTSMNFLAARDIPMPKEGPSVTEVKMLSDWFDGLKGTNGDTPVYVDLDSDLLYYHKGSRCNDAGLSNGTKVTLAFVLQMHYRACPFCAPPTSVS